MPSARPSGPASCNAAPLTHYLTHHCGDVRAAGGGALERSKGSLWASLTHPSTVVPPRPIQQSDRFTKRRATSPTHTNTVGDHTQD